MRINWGILLITINIFSAPAFAAPLCHQVFSEYFASPQQIEKTLLDLATLKLSLDEAQAQGSLSTLYKQALKDFKNKKTEIQKSLNLSEQELATKLRERIARFQDKQNKETKKENQSRHKQDKILNPWKKEKTITFSDGSLGFYNHFQTVSDKHNVSILPMNISRTGMVVIDLNLGTTQTFPSPKSFNEFFVQRNGDRVVLADHDMGFFVFNFITKKYETWDEVTQWRINHGFSEREKPLRRAATLSLDGQNLIWALKDKQGTTIVLVIDISTGKIISEQPIPEDPWFNFVRMLDADNLLLNGAAGLYRYNLKSGQYDSFDGASNGPPHFTNEGKIVVGEDRRWIYRFDLQTNEFATFDMANASGFKAADDFYAWYINHGQQLARVRLTDLSTAGLEPIKMELDSDTASINVQHILADLVLGQNFSKERPIAIYSSHDPFNPIFDFKNLYLDPSRRYKSSTVAQDGKMILIDYYENDIRKIDVWKDTSRDVRK